VNSGNLMLEERSRQEGAGTLPELLKSIHPVNRKKFAVRHDGQDDSQVEKELPTEEHKRSQGSYERRPQASTEMDEFHPRSGEGISSSMPYAKEETVQQAKNAETAAQNSNFRVETCPSHVLVWQVQATSSKAQQSER
jgi:hypothetical protein